MGRFYALHAIHSWGEIKFSKTHCLSEGFMRNPTVATSLSVCNWYKAVRALTFSNTALGEPNYFLIGDFCIS